MNAYIFQAALLCESCGESARTEHGHIHDEGEDSDHYPQGPYPDGGGEADHPQHCDQCQTFLENPLTSEGQRYVMEQLSHPENESDPMRALGFDVRAEWRSFYDYLMCVECGEPLHPSKVEGPGECRNPDCFARAAGVEKPS